MKRFTDEQQGIIHREIAQIFPSLHLARVESLTHATLGVMTGCRLAVSAIGQGMALARGVDPKHAAKQVDRLLSKAAISPWDLASRMVPAVIGDRRDVVVAMDWTEFDADGHSTLALRLVGEGTGRGEGLLWVTMHKEELLGRRNDVEDAVLRRLAETIPEGTRVTIVADRGFGDAKLYLFLMELGFHFVIRFKEGTTVSAAGGETRTAGEWVGKGGRARMLKNATVTLAGAPVPAVVCVQAKDMKEAWCLATSHSEAKVQRITSLYALRWPIEPSFRDEKDLRFGMGLSKTRIADPERRDRLLLISALAIRFLMLLGLAGESLGLDRYLKTNTSKKRQHSLFNQGCMWFAMIPTMKAERLQILMERYEELLRSTDYLAPLLAAMK